VTRLIYHPRGADPFGLAGTSRRLPHHWGANRRAILGVQKNLSRMAQAQCATPQA